ncbi:hypothetical protein, partial [Streptomyces formicae]
VAVAAGRLDGLQGLVLGPVAHQIRTTVDPAFLDERGVTALREWLAGRGVREHVWQPVRRGS